MNKVLLAISAHPDDMEFASGGTMFKYRQKGFEIFLIVATNGENGFKAGHKPRSERVKVRYKEQMAAAQLLGIRRVYFLHYRDGYLKNDVKLRDKIARIIKKIKPEIIVSFDPSNNSFENINLSHRDHRAIAEAAFDAVFAARNRYILPGELHSVKYFYFFGSDKPNHYENITTKIKDKIDLIRQHKSQFNDENKMEKWVKANLSQYTKKYKYSESFRIVKILQPFKESD